MTARGKTIPVQRNLTGRAKGRNIAVLYLGGV